MEPEIPQSGFRFEDPYESKVYEKLQHNGFRGAAAFWRDACFIMATDRQSRAVRQREFRQAPHWQFNAATHLVGHCLREVELALIGVLAKLNNVHQQRDEGKAHRERIRAALKACEISEEDPLGRLWLGLASSGRGMNHRAQVKGALETLGIEDDPLGRLWLDGLELHRYAHRRGQYRGPRPMTDEFREMFGRITRLFLRLLERLEENFLKVFRVLDGILAQDSPTAEDIKTLKEGVPQNPASLGYFFGRLSSPKWLGPLTEAGFFSALPEPVPEGDLLRFPPWPPGLYLVHMAAVDPVAVASVISHLPETENYVVHWHILDAALAMPASCAAEISAQVRVCVRGRYSLGIGQKVKKLVEHLVKEGEVDAALSIAEAMLDLSGDDEQKKRALRGFGTHVRHEYEETFRTLSPMLTNAAGVRWMSLLVHFLTGAIRLDREGETDDAEDGSAVWCRAVEQNEHPAHGLKVMLLTALREAAEEVVRKKPNEAGQVIEAVREGHYKVFRRLELHLLRLFPEGRENHIREILSSREEYEQRSHEYRMLLAEHFRHLPEEIQRQYLEWVAEKPDVERMKAWWKEQWDRDVDEEEILKGWEQDQLHRLAGLREWLPPEWKTRYEQLVAKHYEPSLPSYVVPRATVSWVEPETPKSADELAAMPLEGLLGFLRRWQPESSRFGELSPEGLGRELEQVVAKSPERFADAAESLTDLAPTYVRHVLSGLKTACGSEIGFDWRPVLALCKWVMDRPVMFDQDTDHLTADKGWNWTQGQVADLLQAGLASGNAGVPFALRNDVWDCIVPLTDSPDPTPQREREEMTKYDREPCELSINSVRGEGMELAVRYALWVRRHFEAAPDAKKWINEGFTAMPEVRGVLDKHLERSVDPSLAIRSVYGQWYPWLAMLDESWATESAGRVFPLDEQSTEFLAAAWDTYIVMNRLYDSVYRILEAQYASAVGSLDRPKEDVGHLGNPDTSLTEHLIVLRASGVISETDAVWRAFSGVDREDIRRRAITFVADVFRENEEIPEAHADFLRSFIEDRLTASENAAKQGKPSPEWEAFGWFFAAKSLDDDWLLSQLGRVLALTGGVIDPDFHVFERLPGIAQKQPERAVKCLRAIIEANREGWAVAGHEEEIRQVTQAALGAGDAGARQAARDFLNYLASRGWPQFRDLLPNES